MSDHLPVCGRCGDLGEVGAERCVGCGKRLYGWGVKARTELRSLRTSDGSPPSSNVPTGKFERWLVAEGLAAPTADGLVATERGLELGAGIA